MKKNQLNINLVVGFISVSCATSLFLSQNSFADDIVTDVAVDVPAACTIAGTVDTPHTREMESGTYREDIGTTTFKVICNDNSGFSVYAVGYSNEKIGNNKMLATVSGELAPSFDIVTGTASSGNTSNWAMKLTPVAGTYAPTILSDTNGSFSSYHVVPESYARVATFPNGTDGTNGSAFTSTYATYVTSAQPSGTYSSKVKYTIVHPANEAAPLSPQPSTPKCITYYANASTAQGTMGTQCNLTDGATITLYASNFSRTGYGFAGWTDAYDYAANPNAKFYGPQETIRVPGGTTANGLSLYAVWVKSTGTLQDANKVTELCGTTTTNGTLVQAPAYGAGTANLSSVSALTDQRDNQTYAIAKLADGKCWMIENLRLDNQYTVGNNQTDPSVTNESLSQGYNPSFIGLADPESAKFSNSITPNSLYTTETDVEGKNTISGSNQGYRFPRYNNDNTSQRAANTTNTDVNTYSYGNYYTWAAVIADTTDYASGNHNTTSICPTGWHIPTGNTSGEYYTLNANTNSGATNTSTGLRAYPTNFLYSGYFYISSISRRGGYGLYWSSTAYSAIGSYDLYPNSTSVTPGTGTFYKYSAGTARCALGP
ncbi:hypothetical protein IKF04_03450 [Candidatus Saccharibacteria bacterium]|nr:hypothetical protein [Candidatus Saccharibacteria bacterium]